MFQCRFDGCTKSYNHATSLNKHKKLYHGVAQNGRKLSAEEYQKFVAHVSAGRCRVVLKKSTKETNKSVDTAIKNRVPMKTSKSSASIGKQPRKSWSPIVSDVSSNQKSLIKVIRMYRIQVKASQRSRLKIQTYARCPKVK
jgi:hypothetical protein